MGNETNKEKKGKAAIVDEPMTPVPLDQRQHWITPAVIFGGLEFCVPILMIGATLIGAFGIKGMVPVVLFTFLVLTWAGNSVSGYIGAKTGLRYTPNTLLLKSECKGKNNSDTNQTFRQVLCN